MCGILVYTHGFRDVASSLRPFIQRRGPDYYGVKNLDNLTAESSVLSLRSPITPQPMVSGNNILCYNGQLYNNSYMDTLKVMETLSTTDDSSSRAKAEAIENLFSFEGEFAFVYIENNIIYFARDQLGRRSLLYKQNEDGIIISSVGEPGFVECLAFGVFYTYDMSTNILETHTASKSVYPPVSTTLDLEPSSEPMYVDNVLNTLKEAVSRRLVLPAPNTDVAVLFSGGLDCTLLAALIDDLLPPTSRIYLLNVAFENRRTNTMYDTPDRILARRSYEELMNRRMKLDGNSESNQRFVLTEIDVPYEQACAAKDQVVQLMYPNASVMDLSIALAFYFAAMPQDSSENPRIIFSGLGADELYAGYSRHTSMRNSELAEELQLDFSRLPHRNLGRDDRVISDQARDVRYPFLDKDFVNLALETPLCLKSDGVDTKIALRKVALLMNLPLVSTEKKRAIQFGARSAKMDPGSGRLKGKDGLN